MEIRCGCKINLSLKIVGHVENGYHLLDTVLYPLKFPYDSMHISEKTAKGIDVTCAEKGIDPKNNTIIKAYDRYVEASGFAPSMSIELIKRIPHGAGLGGGSSNAAELLKYVQEKNPNPLDFDVLIQVAAQIGADVPFFLYNEPCHATGIGEILSPKHVDLKGKYILLIFPDIHISTAWAFQQFDIMNDTIQNVLKNPASFPKMFCMENDFESVIFKIYPFLSELKNILIQKGAFTAMLSGSGSSIYGLFDSFKCACDAHEMLGKMAKNKRQCGLYAMSPYEL